MSAPGGFAMAFGQCLARAYHFGPAPVRLDHWAITFGSDWPALYWRGWKLAGGASLSAPDSWMARSLRRDAARAFRVGHQVRTHLLVGGLLLPLEARQETVSGEDFALFLLLVAEMVEGGAS